MDRRVECRSDLEYPGRPLAFYWQGQRLEIVHILADARTPQGKLFRVSTAGEAVFELIYDEAEAVWHIQPYSLSTSA